MSKKLFDNCYVYHTKHFRKSQIAYTKLTELLPLEITLLAGKRKMLENGWLVYLCFDKLLSEVKFLVFVEYLGSENRNLAQFSFLEHWEIIVASSCKPSFDLSFTTKKNIIKSIILSIIVNQNNCKRKIEKHKDKKISIFHKTLHVHASRSEY